MDQKVGAHDCGHMQCGIHLEKYAHVRLDMVLINVECNQQFQHAECRNLTRTTSDHKPFL